jgi:hypothetical protein
MNRVWFALFQAVIRSSAWASVALFFKDCQKYFEGLPDTISDDDLVLIGCHFGILSHRVDDSKGEESSIWSPMGRIVRSMSNRVSQVHIPIDHVAQIAIWKIVEAQESRSPVKAFEGISDHSNFPGVDERMFRVVEMRYLNGKGETLDFIGKELGLTRERVRQIEREFFRDFDDGRLDSRVYVNLSEWVLIDLFDRRGSSLLGRGGETDENIKFAARGLGVPITELGDSGISVLGPLDFPKFAFDVDYTDFHDATKFFDSREIYSELRSLLSNDLVEEDISYIAENLYETRLSKAKKGHKVVVALTGIGQASHYSEITAAYNEMFTDDVSSERNIHAALGRQQYGVVHIGQKGTFGLRQWGDVRPEQGLYELATEITTSKYLQTSKPVPIEIIKEEIEKVRPLNEASLPFITGMNENLRVVLGPAFLPVEEAEIAFISNQTRTSRLLPNECAIDFGDDWDWIGDLPGQFIVGPEITAKNLTNFRNLDKSISIGTLHAYVHHGIGPSDLPEILSSHGRLEQVHNAIRRFESNLKDWQKFNGRDRRWHWLIPEPYLDVDHDIPETAVRDWVNEVGSTELKTLLRRESFLKEWVRYISLEALNISPPLRIRDRTLIVTAFINLAYELTGEAGIEGPWDPRFGEAFKGLSIYCLHQYKGNQGRRLDTLLGRLAIASCNNLGHLTMLQADVWTAIDKVPFQAWLRLYTKLNQS